MAARPSTTSGSIFAPLDSARKELLASFRGLTEEQLQVPLPDGWSVKDLLAHVAMWDEMELPDMRRAARADRPALESDDYSWIGQWNHIQFALRKEFPLRQVLAELAEARQAMMDFLAMLPDERLTTGTLPAACAIQAEHDRDHAAQIRNWRQKQGI